MQWSEYTASERLKALRGGMTQEQLAEAAGVSVGVVRKLERGGTASLPSLLSIADALGTDIAVLLGQQAPRRSMDRDERAALRLVSAATHDAAIGIPAEVEPGTVEELRAAVRRADAAYWGGRYTELGTLLGRLLPEARARFDAAGTADREAAGGVLIDTFQTAGMADLTMVFLMREGDDTAVRGHPRPPHVDARLAGDLGQAVHDRRTELGLSQTELAERAGMTQPQVSRMEGGDTVPTLPLLRRLAKALDGTLKLTIDEGDSHVTFTPHAA